MIISKGLIQGFAGRWNQTWKTSILATQMNVIKQPGTYEIFPWHQKTLFFREWLQTIAWCTSSFIFECKRLWFEIDLFYYCQTQKTVKTWKISGMLIVWWTIKIIMIMFRTRQQTSKPQTNYRCCLRFSFLMPYWLFPRNTITFHK